MGFMYKGQEIPTGGGTDITAGDGMRKEGNTLNVDNPNRGIMTQTEYDALTEEQKASGTYFVDDGQSGGCFGGDVYSTEEQRIGTWIDGKQIYRKSAQFITPSIATCHVDSVISEDIEEVISYFGLVSSKKGTKYVFPSPYITLEHTSTAGWFLNVLDPDQYNSPITLTMEYTKTTDPTPTQEVSA